MVNAAYGDPALSRSIVSRWYGRFRDGREDIEDDDFRSLVWKAPKQNSTCYTGHMWIWWLVPFARQRPVPQRDNRPAVFGPTKNDCARPPSVFAKFSTCWLLLSEIRLEWVPLWLDFGHPDSRDNSNKHHCKGRLLQRHPEAVGPCKSVCKVTRDLCQKLNNKSVFFSRKYFL